MEADPSEPEPSTRSVDKVRLMCSYKGHILPRPHDKTLFYAGGETRLVGVPRATAASLPALLSHLSSTLRIPLPFSLKYQLPDHDLDSLVSLSSDEDLSNMLDEYNRPSSRLRFFLFPSPDGHTTHDLKTDAWFIDALRTAGVNPDSASLDDKDNNKDNRDNREDSSFGSNNSSTNSLVVRDRDDNSGSRFHGVKLVLPSLDSLGSDNSVPSPNFSQQAIVYQDASEYPESKPISTNPVEIESNISDHSSKNDILTPIQVSGYVLSKPADHPPQVVSPPAPPQQYIHHASPHTHYVSQYYPSPSPITVPGPVTSYPTMYHPYVQAQNPVQYHHTNQPYPMYMMPASQAQSLYAIQQTIPRNQPQMAPNPVIVAPHMVYEGYKPAGPTTEYTANVHAPNPTIQNPPSQPVFISSLESANYVNEYEDPMHAQIYKSQPTGPTLPSQLQTTTMAENAMLSESLTHLQVENTKQ